MALAHGLTMHKPERSVGTGSVTCLLNYGYIATATLGTELAPGSVAYVSLPIQLQSACRLETDAASADGAWH